MRGIWSPGVAGLYTPQAALQKLLTGTGIGYRLTGADKATARNSGHGYCDRSHRASLARHAAPANPAVD